MSKKFMQYVSVLLAVVLVLQPFMVATIVESTGTEPRTVYHETFANGVGVANQAGDARVEVASDKVFAGNEDGNSIYISQRVNNWDGIDINFNDVSMENGSKYTVTITGYVDEEVSVPSGAEVYLQIPTGEYLLLANTGFVAGQAFSLTAEYTVTADSMRIQSNLEGASVPFYIGDILITTVDGGSETPPEPIQIAFFDFENGVQGWTGRGNADLSVTEDAFEGTQALVTTGRTANWHGPSRNATTFLEKEVKYEVSGYVKLVTGQQPDNVKLSVVQTGAVSSVNLWPTLSGPLQVTDTDWVHFTGEYIFEHTVSSVSFHFESDRNDTEFIIDNVKIVRLPTEPNDENDAEELDQAGVFSDFEDGAQGWVPRGSGYQAIATGAAAYRSNQSLLTNPSTQFQGPLLNVFGKMHPGHIYDLSVWVKMDEGQPSTSLRIGVQSGSNAFTNVSPDVTVTNQEWVQLSGQFTLSSNPTLLNVYVELVNQPSAERLFYIDNFELKHVGKISEQDRPRFKEYLPSISETYKNHFLIGNASSMNEFHGERLLHLKHHHNLVTAENVMKPEYFYNETGDFDATEQNEFVNAVLGEEFKIHGHVLIWHEQTREELHTAADGTPLPREEALANMERHIEAVMNLYGDDVLSWDVVNEAIVETSHPNDEWEKSLRDTGWKRAIGDDYVEQAFRIAKSIVDENEWDMKLYYNDYNDHIPNKAETVYHMVKDINERYAEENHGEVLISGLGMQGHYNEFTNLENVRSSLELFNQLEIEIGVTELDIVSGSSYAHQTEAEEIRQAQVYAQLFQIYREFSDNISRVTFWGLDDGVSWRSDRTPTLFRSNLDPKLAYYAVINPEKFLEEYPIGGKVIRQGEAVFGTPEINGTIDNVWNRAPRLTLDRISGAWNVQNGFGRVLWDEENLYVLIEVFGVNLDKSSRVVHEHDSVEIFIDRENLKSTTYQEGIAQYRVNFINEASFNPGTEAAREGFESATTIGDNNYIVEMKIPFNETTPEEMKILGLDLQINYANNGQRINIATWNDISGQGWNDPSVFGEVTLVFAEPETEGAEETEELEGTEGIEETEAPESTEGIEETEAPESTEGIEETEAPESTEGIEETEAPESTEGIEETEAPESTEGIEETEAPESTEGIEETEAPESTEGIEETEAPESTEGIEETEAPEAVGGVEETESVEGKKRSTERTEGLNGIEGIRTGDNETAVIEKFLDDASYKVPNTATNLYNYLFIGVLLLFAGILMVVRKKNY
ncbi:endo-1,4-beta-xylanase [Bacillus alkalicellulosilyticus]|uniref:endo-1,4-beta-xylanase n=1 Tax=Alkalihalobacterium alkalicellulosilyticum TaxID=1912214 RepID=UPI000998E218|nr:endo-1,4-beta-xylanase [Bacillus alkalicellulosilyticus]